MRASLWGPIALLAAMAVAGTGHAAAFQKGHCKVEVPADWQASANRTARADKKVWARLIEAPSAAEVVTMETGMKAVKVSEDASRIVMVSTVSAGGQTNKQFHVITKTSPACVADVTTQAGPDEALAKQVGLSVSVAK